ncbi:MAG: hypothetical protein OEL83_14230 [Desulforhopalus sp.]|nr:hypothetical protein [Desulforhopalus sp.]
MEQLKTGDKINMFRDRSPDAVALDNLIRKTLRVSDPANAGEMAKALRNYYPTDREFMAREAAGMPFVSAPVQAVAPQAVTSTSAEVEQAVSDVEQDLSALTHNAILKDIEPELRGWATAVRTAIASGIHAARFALDPRQRDSAFAARRHLGNYARMARAVGTLTPAANPLFRSFAQSIDEVAAVILVLIGESLANAGIGGGKFILQAPVSEIQARRDAVIYSLRNLVGSTQDAYGPNEWPRGLQAYQQLMKHLGNNAQHDLRALFQESELAELMDELIHLAVGSTAEGYRALGSTAMMALERFNRLIHFGQDVVKPESPPLASFVMSLKLFLNAFDNGRQGHRLMTIARPPILFYGLYGMKQDSASQRLLQIIIHRGQLAEELDCCSSNKLSMKKRNLSFQKDDHDKPIFLTNEESQICLDKILYDIDRTIDLYALGTENFGKPEKRAGACACIIKTLSITPAIYSLSGIRTLILKAGQTGWVSKEKEILYQELRAQQKAEYGYDSLLQAMAPSCFNILGKQINPVILLIQKTINQLDYNQPKTKRIPQNYESSLDKAVSFIDKIDKKGDRELKIKSQNTAQEAAQIAPDKEEIDPGNSDKRV